jgi:hypothetical protein
MELPTPQSPTHQNGRSRVTKFVTLTKIVRVTKIVRERVTKIVKQGVTKFVTHQKNK